MTRLEVVKKQCTLTTQVEGTVETPFSIEGTVEIPFSIEGTVETPLSIEGTVETPLSVEGTVENSTLSSTLSVLCTSPCSLLSLTTKRCLCTVWEILPCYNFTLNIEVPSNFESTLDFENSIMTMNCPAQNPLNRPLGSA